MKDSPVWQKRKQAQKKIIEALEISEGGISVKLPSEMVSKDEYHLKLNPSQINEGVSAFILTLLLSAGSTPTIVGKVDLYQLLQHYLLVPDFRSAANELMKKHPLTSEHVKAPEERIS